MNLGGFFKLALVIACLSLALGGCGDDNASDSAASTDSALPPTSATGASGKSGTDKKSDAKSASKDSGDDSASASGPRGEKISPDLTSKEKQQVKTAFNRVIAALNSQDTDYLCNKAYSADFTKQQEQNGGCEAISEKAFKVNTGYSAKPGAVYRMPGSEVAAVDTTLVINKSSGAKLKNKVTLYFVEEGGSWKRAVPPAPSGTPIG